MSNYAVFLLLFFSNVVNINGSFFFGCAHCIWSVVESVLCSFHQLDVLCLDVVLHVLLIGLHSSRTLRPMVCPFRLLSETVERQLVVKRQC